MAQWLMANDFKPEVGHAFQFKTSPMPQVNFNGIIDCQVLEVNPFTTLTYSWKSESGNGETLLDTVVHWTLVEKDGGTSLQLLHNGFVETDAVMFPLLNKGWAQNMQKIETRLNPVT